MKTSELSLLALGVWLVYKLVSIQRSRSRLVKLHGPQSSSWLFGVSRDVFQGDSGALFEGWADEFGSAFQITGAFGARRTVLFDAKAIANFFAKDTFTMVQSSFSKKMISNIIGKGLLYAEGDSHRRQRRALTPAFSNAAIRNLTPVFFDSAYKVKGTWDSLIETSSTPDAIIDVQKWMNCVSLDSIGIAGFGHDFGALEGKESDVKTVFDSFGHAPPAGLSLILPILGPVLPLLTRIPTKRSRMTKRLHESMAAISEVLLERSRKEKEAGSDDVRGSAGQTIIGALLKAENADSQFTLTADEVLSQMKVLILAGYETTSISLTWALMELALHPEKQDRLRLELASFSSTDPSYDQLSNSLPYLDAVMREILRLHPALHQLQRVAKEDEILPFDAPVTTASGEMLEKLSIPKDHPVIIPIRAINRSTAVWGPDAKEFKPERWLEGEQHLPSAVTQFHGYHHLLTFVDGPRICLGRGFAVAEFKAVLTVLIRNFVFEMRDGPDTKVDTVISVLQRPKVEGVEGSAMPMRVRRYES